MTNPYATLELLAPAGDSACLHAAVRAGADAVYLGCQDFNARRGAGNFTLENLGDACDFAHLRGASVYLTLNTVILPDEIGRAVELARQAWRRGVDAFIVQDLGLASELRRVVPEAPLHLSTQMNTHNIDGVHAAAVLGAQRITLARELSFGEIATVAEEAHSLGMSIESFGHGALCVCYSGQCFMSSMIGGRSANRGMCAQACRLPYELYRGDRPQALPSEGEHLLSPKDLCSADVLPALVASGIDSVKIEGRMKSAEYVYAVVGTYRGIIERLAARFDALVGEGMDEAAAQARLLEDPAATPDERSTLAEAFSRGFTQGYLARVRDNSLMGYGRPNNRGVFVGRVLRCSEGQAAIMAETPLHDGDVLEIWMNKGRVTVTVDEPVESARGEYRFAVDKRLNKGDRVFRVRDADLAFRDDAFEPRIGVRGFVRAKVGEPLLIRVSAQGVSVDFEGQIVEAARTKPVTNEEAFDHIDRLGNTPFYFESLEVNFDANAGMGFSALHKARTQALRRLEDALLTGMRNRFLQPFDKRQPALPCPRRDLVVAALATNPACARAAMRAGADMVYVPALNYPRGEAALGGVLMEGAGQAGYPGKRVIAMPVVDKPSMNAEPDFDPWQYAKPDKPLLVESFGQLIRGLEEGMGVEVGPHVPVTNGIALQVMAGLGVQRVWLSPELSLRQIAQLGKHTPVELGITVCGYQELMVTEHCLLMSQGPCNQRCSQCARRKAPHFLKDRKGYEFAVVTDMCGRSHLYNAVRLDAAHVVGELAQAGVSAFMVDTTLMDAEETAKTVGRFVRARDAVREGKPAAAKAEGCTTGHLFRGVL